jgi:hypothetical protein
MIQYLLWSVFFAIRDNWLELLKIVGAAVAFGIGVSQYRKAQAWKRVEFVASEMRFFFDDEQARDARAMLDRRLSEITLRKRQVSVDYEIVAQCLTTDLKFEYEDGLAIREKFERLLEFLARFEGFIQAGVVKERDFTPYLDYWLRLLAGNDRNASAEVTNRVLPALWHFIHTYEYIDVVAFVGRYQTLRKDFRR